MYSLGCTTVIFIIIWQFGNTININMKEEQYKCVTNIFDTLKRDSSTTLIISDDIMDDTVDILNIMQKNETYLLLSNVFMVRYVSINTKSIVIISKKISTIRRFFESWRNSRYFRSNSKYLIFYKGSEDLKEIGHATWITHAFRSIIIDKNFNIYKLKGYSSELCKLAVLERLPSCNISTILNVFTREYNNFYGCPFTVLARKDVQPNVVNIKSTTNRGWEPLLLENMAAMYNFTLVYLDHNITNSTLFVHDEIPCCFYSTIWEGKADILIGMIYTTYRALNYFDVSTPYPPVTLNFIVFKAQPLPAWIHIAYIFTKDTWLTFLVTMILFIITAYFILKIKHSFEEDAETNLTKLIFDILAVPFTETIRFPKEWIARLLLLTWVLFAFIFSSSFASAFTSFLVQPVYERQINSKQDIIDTGFPIHSTKDVENIFQSDLDRSSLIIKYRLKILPPQKLLSAVQLTIDSRKIVSVVTSSRLEYAISALGMFVNKDKSLQIHIIDPILTYGNWIVMQRGLPLYNVVNKYLDTIHETGLLQYYLRNTTIVKYKQVRSEQYVPIGIDHIFLAFILLLCGLVLSCIVICVEFVLFLFYPVLW